MDFDEVLRLHREGYISQQHHPECPLLVWNYTHRAQFDRVWTPETMACRGLITDEKFNIIARPFKKFFNLGEQGQDIPSGPFEITEKLDGSLGIMYFVNGKPYLSTRGSFTSEQAIHANQLLRQVYNHLPWNPEITYLWEILYPGNKIVIDYGELDDIVLLAMIETKTGTEIPLPSALYNGIRMVKRFPGVPELSQLTATPQDNQEGFVIRWEDGFRLKMKFAEYVRLHRLVTGVNSKVIWEMLRDRKPIQELIERVPDEFSQWVRDTINTLHQQYALIEDQAKADFKDFGERKANALYYQTKLNPSILFSILDKRDYTDYIWKLIRPKAERPFKDQSEDI